MLRSPRPVPSSARWRPPVFLTALVLLLAVLVPTAAAQTTSPSFIWVSVTEASGRPVVGQRVHLYRMANGGSTLVASGTVNANGDYAFNNLQRGVDYKVKTAGTYVGVDHLEPLMWYRTDASGTPVGTRRESAATTIRLSDSRPYATARLSFGRLTGAVTDAAGATITANLLAILKDRRDPSWTQHGGLGLSTDAQGRFGTDNAGLVVPGDYTVQLWAPYLQWVGRHVPSSKYGGADSDDARYVAVNAGQQVTLATQKMYSSTEMPPPPYVGASTGRRVAVVGDSLTQESTTEIHAELDTAVRSSVTGIGGMTIRHLGPVSAKYMAATQKPTEAIVALGTNDALTDATAAAAINDLKALIRRYQGVDCLSVMTVNKVGTTAQQQVITDINRQIWQLHHRTDLGPKKVQVAHAFGVDWAAWVASGTNRANWIDTDGIHLTPAGERAYGQMMRAAVNHNCT